MAFPTESILEPMLLDQYHLNEDENVFLSARLVSPEYPADRPLHILPSAVMVLGPRVKGSLFVDFWEDQDAKYHLGYVAFEIGEQFINYLTHRFHGPYVNRGFPFLAISLVQNVTGWSRRLIGLNELPNW
ncbi:hypothetical protein [Roseibium sp.]|uniref:hypothetical protein n=1 Tax=Roseibium sp. TaxID=1936156 RepID=UPI00391B9B1B